MIPYTLDMHKVITTIPTYATGRISSTSTTTILNVTGKGYIVYFSTTVGSSNDGTLTLNIYIDGQNYSVKLNSDNKTYPRNFTKRFGIYSNFSYGNQEYINAANTSSIFYSDGKTNTDTNSAFLDTTDCTPAMLKYNSSFKVQVSFTGTLASSSSSMPVYYIRYIKL